MATATVGVIPDLHLASCCTSMISSSMHEADVETTGPLKVIVPVASASHSLLIAKVPDDLS